MKDEAFLIFFQKNSLSTKEFALKFAIEKVMKITR